MHASLQGAEGVWGAGCEWRVQVGREGAPAPWELGGARVCAGRWGAGVAGVAGGQAGGGPDLGQGGTFLGPRAACGRPGETPWAAAPAAAERAGLGAQAPSGPGCGAGVTPRGTQSPGPLVPAASTVPASGAPQSPRHPARALTLTPGPSSSLGTRRPSLMISDVREDLLELRVCPRLFTRINSPKPQHDPAKYVFYSFPPLYR